MSINDNSLLQAFIGHFHQRIDMFSKSQRFADQHNKTTPGPGEYNVKLSQAVTTAAFPKEQRFSDSSDTEGLGPGAYGPPVVGKPKNLEFKVPSAKQQRTKRGRKAVGVQTDTPYKESSSELEEALALQVELDELKVKHCEEQEEHSSRISALESEHNNQISQLNLSLETHSRLVSQLRTDLSDAIKLADAASADKLAADAEVSELQLISQKALQCKELLQLEKDLLSAELGKERLQVSDIESKLKDAQDEERRLTDKLAEAVSLLSATKDEMAERVDSLQKALNLQDETIASLTASISQETELRLATEASLENKSETIACLMSTVDQLRAGIQEWEILHSSRSERHGRLEEQVTSTSSTVSVLTDQLGQLRLANEQFRAQAEMLQSASDSSAETVRQQEQVIQQREAEIGTLKEKLTLSRLQQEQLREYDAKIDQLVDLNNLLSAKQKDYESLKNEIGSMERLVTSVKDKHSKEISSYESLLTELKREKETADKEMVEQKEQYSERIASLETEVCSLQQLADTKQEGMERQTNKLWSENESVKVECARAQFLYNELQEKIAPFREQLDAFELERKALEGRSKNWENEAAKATQEYAKLLGHQNQKQKIKRIDKISEENFTLKQEVMNMRSAEAKMKHQLHQLQDRVRSLEGKKRFDPNQDFQGKEDKENSLHPKVSTLTTSCRDNS
ncbi:hyaluronan-mediated motility receptor-like isoform X2 [Watersipora subatra]|uniref:hyaluronan-mediated motility receptor-like isoform X2 n=1 Tax=Watersipora subatra TaxID=2589382 RepID=UPI00355C0FB5